MHREPHTSSSSSSYTSRQVIKGWMHGGGSDATYYCYYYYYDNTTTTRPSVSFSHIAAVLRFASPRCSSPGDWNNSFQHLQVTFTYLYALGWMLGGDRGKGRGEGIKGE